MTIEPSLLELSRLTEEQLSQVPNFKVSNSYGKITFLKPVDLRGINLDDVIMIKHKKIEIYPSSKYDSIPAVGEGLNQPAILEYYQWPLPNKYSMNFKSYAQSLKLMAKEMNAEFVNYSPEKQTLTIRIPFLDTQ